MKADLIISSEARTKLLSMIEQLQASQPMVVLHWHEATADVLREIDGGTSIVRVPAKGNLDVVDGKGTVAERWLTDIQGIPFFTPPMLPGSIFHISLESDLLKVEKHGG